VVFDGSGEHQRRRYCCNLDQDEKDEPEPLDQLAPESPAPFHAVIKSSSSAPYTAFSSQDSHT